MKHYKTLKIGSLYRPAHTMNGIVKSWTNVPFIRISGKWLTELGFNIEDQVTLIVEQNKIIITKENQK